MQGSCCTLARSAKCQCVASHAQARGGVPTPCIQLCLRQVRTPPMHANAWVSRRMGPGGEPEFVRSSSGSRFQILPCRTSQHNRAQMVVANMRSGMTPAYMRCNASATIAIDEKTTATVAHTCYPQVPGGASEYVIGPIYIYIYIYRQN